MCTLSNQVPEQIFNFQLKKCGGVCVGKESIAQHNMRLLEAFDKEKIQQWPFAGPACICECSENPADDTLITQAIHVIDQWAYLGCVEREEEIADLLANRRQSWFDKETYRLLNRYIHLARPVEQEPFAQDVLEETI